MYSGLGGREFRCTISGYCHTQIFELPESGFHPDGDEPHEEIYSGPSMQACVTSNLVDYFLNSTYSKHYTISPSLRHVVGETDTKVKSQQNGRLPVFLVIDSFDQLTPVVMIKGECTISDEVVERNGEKTPMLVGGREGEQFITACATVHGVWPELPNNQLFVTTILAAVRAGQQTSDPIRKYVDQNCLVTDDGRYVNMTRLTMSARLSIARPMDITGYRDRVSEIRSAITAMTQDIGTPHMELLFRSMYNDECKGDSYQRLQYLRLWESLADAGPRYLNCSRDKIKYDEEVVGGRKTLRELTAYRGDIAH